GVRYPPVGLQQLLLVGVNDQRDGGQQRERQREHHLDLAIGGPPRCHLLTRTLSVPCYAQPFRGGSLRSDQLQAARTAACSETASRRKSDTRLRDRLSISRLVRSDARTRARNSAGSNGLVT